MYGLIMLFFLDIFNVINWEATLWNKFLAIY